MAAPEWVEVGRHLTPAGNLVVTVSVRPAEHVNVVVPGPTPSEEQIRRAVEAALRHVDLEPPPPERW